MDFVAKHVATNSTSTAAPKCPRCVWIGAISGSSCKCLFKHVYQKNRPSHLLSEREEAECAFRQHSSQALRDVSCCHSVVRLFPSPGDSGAPSLPPLTSRRMRESLTRFPRWDKGFTLSCSWTLMIQSLMAAVPNVYLLFKGQLLPPPMVCFTVGELMEIMWKEQGFICEFLQSKFEMFVCSIVCADKPPGSCHHHH